VTDFARGALIEYGSDFLGPLPNVVVFQYNVEELARQFEIHRRGTDDKVPARQREVHRAHSAPTEGFTLNLRFSAADDLNDGDPIATTFGVGPQLAALEKMVNPVGGLLSGAIGAVVDTIGDALSGGGGGGATRLIPPQQLPRILFVAGLTRVLPVEIKSFSITEKLFDRGLQPIGAEVQVGLEVVTFPPDSDDVIGQGALEYTNTVKDAQAVANLGKAIQSVTDIIPF
jgi:hypothetical protein